MINKKIHKKIDIVAFQGFSNSKPFIFINYIRPLVTFSPSRIILLMRKLLRVKNGKKGK